ncbi:MAG TPA: response regulator [Candidatus Dormibacteraeota bacterium]|nr:response regulator [Candidatus Dormibacteraeota bacterium]
MAKILVADDNSNIQKMVGLALKDQGIDVVAVGNGEAAVRKISDIIPDLVLADVFMPVRNGYEVCQYVKQDPALAHIPVILLVGAFDPLDEQEAQRVGADGVLKKPFVPPDPLIAMVKAALTRAGVSYSSDKARGDGAPKPVDKKSSEMLKPRPVPAAAPIVIPTPTIVPPESIAMDEIDMVEEVSMVSTTPAPVNMEGAPLAFANLMDNAGADVAEDPAFAPPVGMERDWRTAEESADVPEEEEEEQPKASWRRDREDDEETERGTGGASSRREAAFEEAGSRKSAREEWDTPAALPAMTEAAATEVAPGSFPHLPATETPAAPFSAEAWNHAIAAGVSEVSQAPSGTGAQTLTAEAAPEAIAVDTTQHSSGRASGHASEVAENTSDVAAHGANGNGGTRAFEHDAVTTAIDRFAGSQDAGGELPQGSPTTTGAWEVQAQKASLLAATWDVPVAPQAAETELGLGETRNFAEKAEQEAPKELLAEAGKGLHSLASDAAETIPEVSGEHVAEQQALVGAAGTIAQEQHGEESAYATEQSLEKHVALEKQVASEPQTVEEPVPAQYANETDTGYGAVPVESIDQAGVTGQDSHYQASPISAIEGTVHAEESAVGHFEQVPVEQVPAEDISQNTVAEGAPAAALEASVQAAADGAGRASTDEVVARVLAGLSPEVMQAITRELLKPVVEAMVKEELKKKE